jgi:hypothetical protein
MGSLAGCSSSDDSGETAGNTGGGSSTGGRSSTGGTSPLPDAGGGSAASECHGPGYADGTAAIAFSGLTASVVDESGNPAGHVMAQACGTNVCLNGLTNADGTVDIAGPGSLRRPAFKYGGGQHYARFALPLSPEPKQALDVGEQHTVAFDDPAEGATLEGGTTATSRLATLTLASGATITIDPFDFDTDDLKKFRAAEVPKATWPDAVDATLTFAMVVALTPSDAEICPAAKLSVKNTAKLAAGTLVDFFVHGTDVSEAWAPYGGWAKVSSGHVSEDGATIDTDDNGGIPILSAVGIRASQGK